MSSKKQKEMIRSRAPNFTKEEQEIFLKVIEPYIPIIESKKADSIKQVDKQKAWALITAKFNSNISYCARATENLISCYRNMKSKVKKQHSEAKTMLKDGGFLPNDDDPLGRLKRIIEPPIDGVCTRDTMTMKQYHVDISDSDRVQPIEVDFIKRSNSLSPEHFGSVAGDDDSESSQETDVCMKDNIYSEIEKKRKKLSNDNVAQLSEEKLALTKINREIAAEELKDQKLKVQMKELEMAHNKKIHELQLENLTKENIYKEEMRRKELLLLDLKIESLRRQ